MRRFVLLLVALLLSWGCRRSEEGKAASEKGRPAEPVTKEVTSAFPTKPITTKRHALVSEREAYEVLVQHDRAPRPSPGQRVSEWEAHETLVHAERELLRTLESQGRSVPIVSKEIVERGGQSLVQIRISDSKLARHQVPGLDRPVFIPYTPDALGDGANGEVTSSRKIVQTIGGLMQRGEVAVKPVVVYLALRPNRRIRTWVEGFDGTLEPAEQALLTQRTREISPGDADRLFVMAIVFPRPGQHVNAFDLPTPREWHAAMLRAGRSLTVPGLLQIVWPERPETSDARPGG